MRIKNGHSGAFWDFDSRPLRIFGAIALSSALVLLASAAAPDPSQNDDTGRYASLAELDADTLAELLGDTVNELDDGVIVAPQDASGVIDAGDCKYQQHIDDAHMSKDGSSASTHGWWTKYSGSCPTYSNVDVYLQAVYCDAYGCRWRVVDENSQDRKADNLGGGRVNARNSCIGTQTVGYRSFVDVDLNWVVDPSGFTYSDPRDVRCYPS